VAQHDYFDRQVVLSSAREADELDNAYECHVEEREHHEEASSPLGLWHEKSWWRPRTAFSAPTGIAFHSRARYRNHR
jgi:anti-sigma-K factor RskA